MSDTPPLGIFGLHPGLDGAEQHPAAPTAVPGYHPAHPTPERVEQLRAMPYPEYLESEEWRHRRRNVIHRAQSRCEQCGSRRSLQVHHLTYERLGREHDDDLLVLCARCHIDVHDHAWR